MRQKSSRAKKPAEKKVRDIRRRTRKQYQAPLVLRPEPPCPTRHRKASFDGVHQPMVDTINL